MRNHHDAFASLDGRHHGFVPEGQHTINRVFEALGQWQLAWLQLGITPIVAFTALIVGGHWRRRRVVTAAPYHHLLIAIFFGGFRLVQPLQVTVMPLVESPAMHHRHPGLIHFVEHMPQRARGALEHAGVGHIEVVAFLSEELAGHFGLRNAGFSEVNVSPSSEAVFQVPERLAVAYEYDFVHG